jgi:hypothetical protein
MRLAARYKAQKPDASLEEMAKAAGIPGKRTTIKTYLERPEFRRIIKDETLRTKLSPTMPEDDESLSKQAGGE